MPNVKSRFIGVYEDDVVLTDLAAQLSKLELVPSDADGGFLSFQAARAGGVKDYTVQGTIPQNYDATALYMRMRQTPGDALVLVYAPYGNAEPTVAQPHEYWPVTMDIPNATLAGGEATTSPNAVPVVEVAWPCTADPTIVTAPPAP